MNQSHQKSTPQQPKTTQKDKERAQEDPNAAHALAALGGLGLIAHIAEVGEHIEGAGSQATGISEGTLAIRPQDQIDPAKALRPKA